MSNNKYSTIAFTVMEYKTKNAQFILTKNLSRKILMIGEYFKNNAPGGMAAVLASYNEYFEDMRFIPTWRNGNILVKVWYAIYSYITFITYMIFCRSIKIIHIQGAAFASFERNIFFVRFGKLFGKKVIMHMHCADFESYYNPSKHKKRIIDTINSCDLFLVLSDSWKDYFINIGCKKEIIQILNNTITPPEFIKSNKDNKYLNLLYLGVIGQRKGIYDILKALKDNKDKFEEKVKLRIGGNQEEEKLKNTILNYGLNDMVVFEGFVSGAKKIECLNWADVYILPSFNEGLPIGILEAMSYGHPIISSPVGGIPTIVKDGENGFLVEPGNSEEIAQAINKLLNDRSLIEILGKNSIKIVQPFMPENVFATLKNMYKQLL